MENLTKGADKLFNWLKGQSAGTIVPRSTVLTVANWKEITLRTYLSKNKLAPFLVQVGTDRLKVVMNGSEITKEFFHAVFTQTAPPYSASPK